jgi:hypothetical protein
MNTQLAIEKVLQDFTKELLKVFSAAVVQAVSQVGSGAGSTVSLSAGTPAKRTRGVAAKATRGKRAAKEEKPAPRRRGRPPKVKSAKPVAKTRRGAGKSSPEQVAQLGSKIVDVLKKADRNMTSKEIMKGVGMLRHEEGRFNYAFNKLKEDKVVIQHGERRLARYGIAGASATSEG